MLASPDFWDSNASRWCGQRVVLFDVSQGGMIDYSMIEAIKDGLEIGCSHDASTRRYDSPHVIIFANSEPASGSLSPDRLHIIDDLSDAATLHMLFPPEKFPQVIGLSDPFEQEPELVAGFGCESEDAPLLASSLKTRRHSVLGSPLAIPLPDSWDMAKTVSDGW